MEFAMSGQPCIPNPEVAKRLLANLRQTHLEMNEFNIELNALVVRVEHNLQQQKLTRKRRSQLSFPTESTEVTG
jgi:hypothetical protein